MRTYSVQVRTFNGDRDRITLEGIEDVEVIEHGILRVRNKGGADWYYSPHAWVAYCAE